MLVITLFHDFPLWAIFIVTVLAILLSAEVGYRGGNWRSRSGSREKEAPIGGLVGATLGLLAFLLAFTFSTINPWLIWETSPPSESNLCKLSASTLMRSCFFV